MNQELRGLTTAWCQSVVTHYSRSYKSSFWLFDRDLKAPLSVIYAYARIADEIVDSTEIQQKAQLLAEHVSAIVHPERRASANLLADVMQRTIDTHNINRLLFKEFFDALQMDLHKRTFSRDELHFYSSGVAASIAKMCLQVAARGDDTKYRQCEETINVLAISFQKINFLRDLRVDYERTGRRYLEYISSHNEIRLFVQENRANIARSVRLIWTLPKGCRVSVLLACFVYLIRGAVLQIKYRSPKSYPLYPEVAEQSHE